MFCENFLPADDEIICRTCRQPGSLSDFELGRCGSCRAAIEARRPEKASKKRKRTPRSTGIICPGCGGPKSTYAKRCQTCYQSGRLNNPNWGACPLCGERMRLDKTAKYNSCYTCWSKAFDLKINGVVKECRCGKRYSSQYDECWSCVTANIQFGSLTLNRCNYCHQFFPPEGFSKRAGKRGLRCLGCSSRDAVIASLPRDRYDSYEIAERDGWTCGICGGAIDQSLTDVIDPGYLNMDHVIPVTAPNFPGDIRSNVQASHRLCNIQKGGFKG